MDFLPFNIFPEGSLAGSVITTVWIGVFVVVFFNLRFGWVLSGLVVPGYLIPLVITKPWSATVIVAESVVTYLIVYAFSERWSRFGGWSSLFGRDRFFALVLVGIFVRVFFDGWLLPGVAAWFESLGVTDFDYRSNLQSFGLVIIALTANLFWKTGLPRGMFTLTTIMFITYLLVRYGLMVFTNFSISNVGYMYEDLATSILASPKAYIILLTTAFVASRMNVLYGWDFSGILLPSLLALQWYTPGKVLFSVVEALLILIIARWLMSTRLFADSNIEGGRKLLLFFNIAFIYKFILAWLMGWLVPEVKVSDYFAFGYLLSTLLAVKMHDKEIAARLSRALLQTSLTAAFLASIIGFAFTYAPRISSPPSDVESAVLNATVIRDKRRPSERIRGDKVLLYASRSSTAIVPPSALDIDRFSQAVELLSEVRGINDVSRINWANRLLGDVNYRLRILDDRWFYLVEQEPVHGWGAYMIDIKNRDGIVVESPTAAEERGSAEAAVYLFESLGGRAVALSGAPRTTDVTDVLINAQTFFHTFHRSMASGNVLQVRRLNQQVRRDVEFAKTVDDRDASLMAVRTRLPRNLDLGALNKNLGKLELGWVEPKYENRQRSETLRGFAELFLTPASLLRLQSRAVIAGLSEVDLNASDRSIEGYLNEWLFGGRERLAIRGGNDYVTPKIEEMLFFDLEVIAPLLKITDRYTAAEGLPEDAIDELRTLRAMASVFDYEIIRYQHLETGKEYLILSEREGLPKPRYWGIYILRLGEANPFFVQVPRPLFETGTYEYGVALFERLNARALMIAGAHPDANLDSTADVIQPRNKVSLFNLLNQSLVRHYEKRQRMVVQIRAFGYRADTALPAADVLVAFDDGVFGREIASPLSAQLLKTLRTDQLDVTYVGGSPATAGYEVGQIAQARYLDATDQTEIVVLRLSPLSRIGYRQQSDNRIEWAHFGLLGIPSAYGGLDDHIATIGFDHNAVLPKKLLAIVARYQVAADVILLRRIQREFPQYVLSRYVDRDSQQSFLIVQNRDGLILSAFNLSPRVPEKGTALVADDITGSTRRFIDSGSGRLEPVPVATGEAFGS